MLSCVVVFVPFLLILKWGIFMKVAKLSMIVSFALNAFILSACGGGGSTIITPEKPAAEEPTSPANVDPSPQQPSEPEPQGSSELEPQKTDTNFNLTVLDAYINKAYVFADLNENYKHDEDEPYAETDGKGNVKLLIKNELLENRSYIRMITIAQNGAETDTMGEKGKLGKDLVMSRIVFLDQNSDDSNFVITPFSTLADVIASKYAKKQQQNVDQSNYDRASSDFASSLGVDADSVDKDFNDQSAAKGSSDLINTLIASEIIANNGLLPSNIEDLENKINNPFVTEESINRDAGAFKDDIQKITDGLNDGKVKSALDRAKKQMSLSFNHLSSGATDEWGCGTTDDGTVSCWGVASWGVLGDPAAYKPSGADDFSSQPVPVVARIDDRYVPLNGVVKVAGGNIHACALNKDGEVYCWGGNYHGQLGTVPLDQNISYNNGDPIKNTESPKYAQRVLAGQQEKETGYKYLTNIADITLGHNNTCALTNDGEVYCWGENSSYQLGGRYEGYEKKYHHQVYSRGYDHDDGYIDMTADFYSVVQVPVKLKFPDSVKKVLSISSGTDNHCAVVENADPSDKHNLYCWGADYNGVITGNTEQYKGTVQNKYEGKLKTEDVHYSIEEPWNWSLYETGGDFTYIFGQPITLIKNRDIQISEDHWEKKEFENVTNVASTYYMDYMVLSFKDDPNIYWANGYTITPWYEPDSNKTVNSISANNESKQVCAVIGDENELICAGSNKYGLLGRGSDPTVLEESDEFKPVVDSSDNPLKGVRDVSIRKRSVCANIEVSSEDSLIKTNLYCWGSSTFGQLAFNDHDGGFSYVDTAFAWDNGSNRYFDKDTRYQTKAVNVTQILAAEQYQGQLFFVGDYADSKWTDYLEMTYDEGSDLWNFELDLSADKDYKFKLSKDKSQAGAWGLCSSNPAAQQLCINENPDAEGATFSVDTRGQYLLRAALNVFDKQKIDFSLNKIAFDALYFVGEYSFTNWNLGGDGFLPLDYDPDLKEWSILLEFTDEELQNHPDGMYKICPVNNWNGTCWGKCSEADGSGKLCVNKSADGNANLKVPESGTYIMKIKGTAIDPYYLSYELTRVVD